MLTKLIGELKYLEWQKIFLKFKNDSCFSIISDFLNHADFRKILPARENILRAFTFVEPQNVKLIILGQDPYINRHQATGLAFSVPNNVDEPQSLKNIFAELRKDYKTIYTKRDLCFWAQQGVLLLNATLTVNEGLSNSHAHIPWRELMIKILNELLKTNDRCGILLWGGFAKKIFLDLEFKPYFALSASHPSPLSYYLSFVNCHHFKKANDYFEQRQLEPIKW